MICIPDPLFFGW